MKNNLMRTLLCLMAALVLSLGCALGETAEATEAPAADTTETAAEAAETAAPQEPVLLVTVNGQEIYDQDPDIKTLVDYYTQVYAQYGMDTSDPSTAAMLQEMGMEWAMENVLFRQKAAELGITGLSDEEKETMKGELKTQWDSVVDEIASQMGMVAEDATEEQKAEARVTALTYIETVYGYTEESFIEEQISDADLVKIRDEVTKAVLGEITVAEEEIINTFNEQAAADKESYENNVPMYEYAAYSGQPSYYRPEGFRGIIHILLQVDQELMSKYTDLAARLQEQQAAAAADAEATAEPAEEAAAEATEEATAEPTEVPTPTPEPVTQEMVDEAKKAIMDSVQAQVDEIKAKFQAGTSFTDLIAEYGTDPGMKDAANLANGYEVHAESIMWDPAFTEAAMALQNVGEMGEPVLGQNGVHILYYLRDIPGGTVDMTQEIRDAIQANLLSTKTSQATLEMVEGWKAESDIQYTEAGQALIDAMNAAMSTEAPAESEATVEEAAVEEAAVTEEAATEGAESTESTGNN